MKFFIVFAALVAVAVAGPVRVDDSHLLAIIHAINSPHTDSATAALLQDQLDAILDSIKPVPVEVGPAIVDEYEPISVGPAIIDEYEPISVGPAVIDEYEPISVGPALIEGPIPDPAAVSGSPLVQVIVNVNTPPKPVEDISTGPALIDFDPAPIQPDPVIVVDHPELVPVQIPQPVLPVPAVPIPDNAN
ncbi:uncharacterized protein LOC119831979 [Zerene cesonia]|uniref:uncharacterized protein LOC119831979 n=1 Tax=Zerene cesonia TaxID=33412 RepID=UPI0018E57EC0|nr:uncharacterized protein LOC119831979 [Zerene cesonia]